MPRKPSKHLDLDVLFAAIKAKCLDCSAGNQKEVTQCPAKSCPLHPWRLGNPQVSLFDDGGKGKGKGKSG